MSWGSKLASAGGALIALPFLFLASLILLPAALFSTAAAAFALTLRAAFIYVELALGVAADYVTGRKARTGLLLSGDHNASLASLNTGGGSSIASRPKSVRSFSSTGSQTPVPATATAVSTGTNSVPQSAPPPGAAAASNPFGRDFEGIGGWRITTTGESDDSDDQQWLTMNSRLELPAVSAVAPEERKRHHHRHSTAGAVQGGDRTALRKSASNSSRSRPSSALITGGRSTPESTNPRDAQGRVKSLTQMGSDSLHWGISTKKPRRKGSTSSSGSQNTLVL